MAQVEAIADWGNTEGLNPATGAPVGSVPNTDLGQFDAMVSKARAAQAIWAQKSFRERAQHVHRIRAWIVDNADQMARVVSDGNGKTRIDALATEVLPIAMACEWYAKNAEKHLKERSRATSSLLFFNKKNSLLRVPLGVVGIISPWNYPLSIPFGEVIMGLMAGNAILLKVAAATPMVGKIIEDAIAAGGLPDGLFQSVVGSGGKVATAYLQGGVDKIFFTGSVGVGKGLMAQAAETLTPLSLELGGNDPMLVLADADLERAANGAAWAGFQNCGQSCGGVERIYVDQKVYDQFVELLASKTKALRHGVATDEHLTDLGCLTTAGQLKTVQKHLQDAVERGGRIVAQSQGPEAGADGGYFHPATLLVDVPEDALMIREETFGPLIPVIPFESEEEAVAKANNDDLALTSSVWTRDMKRGKAMARRLQTGVTAINDHLYTHGLSEMPWGGWKDSGLGRTHGPEGLEEMTNLKAINWDILPAKRNLWWYPFDAATYAALKDAMGFVYGTSLGVKLASGLRLTPYLVKKMFTGWKTS